MVTNFEVTKGLTIRTNDRISVFGRTGSGKTFLAKNFLLPHYENYIFWDIKHENSDVPHDIIVHTPTELNKKIKDNKRIIYQPEDPTQKDFDELCRIIFENKNTTLYVDEAALITTPSTIQYWHNVIMTQGRSYDVGIINASQRPRAIHNTLISESEHLFVFKLNLETDIIKLRQQMGEAADEIKYLPEYHFMYYSVRTNKSFIFKPIKSINPEKPTEIPKLELYQPDLHEYLSLTLSMFPNPTKAEKNRFKKLQEQGLLPSQSLRKIETERRLGIIPKEEGILKAEDTPYYIAGGLIGAGILYAYLRR